MATRSESELMNWLLLCQLTGMGPKKLQKWLQISPEPEMWFSHQKPSSKLLAFLNAEKIALNFNWKSAQENLDWSLQSDCHLITLLDSNYPPLLKQISCPPGLLFVRGSAQIICEHQIAMVGSRHPSATGQEHAFEFAKALVAQGLVITSGLACGIDGLCHQGAMAGQGKTIAVLGHGLHHLYPKNHKALAQQIVERGGALVSEYPLSVGPKPYHFPQRNRIVSGLSLGVVVVEATLKSGSLITAHTALDQGREVFAIPGSVHNPLAKGCHHLIRQGAKCVESIDHILEELNPSVQQALVPNKPHTLKTEKTHKEALSSTLKMLLSQIGFECTPIDRVVERSGLPLEQVSSQLMELELEGRISLVPGGYVRI